MFNKKPQCPDPFADKVKCDECKHWIDKSDAQEVHVMNSPWRDGNTLEYFCPQHKKNYTKKRVWGYGINNEYYQTMVVSEDGTPVGYEKIKEKK